MFSRELLCAALVLSLVLVLAGRDNVSAADQDAREPVLLEDVVAEFKFDWPDNYWETMEIQAAPHSMLWFYLYQMHAAGWDEDINTVVSVAGAGGLYGYERDEFLAKYAFMLVGGSHRIAEATGFGYEWIRADSVDAAWEVLVESIDSGRPVMGEHAEILLFGGYEDADDVWGRKVFVMMIEPDYVAGWWTWERFSDWFERWAENNEFLFGRHTERVAAKDPREIAVQVLADLVTWSVRPPAACDILSEGITWGLAGMEAYAMSCADMAACEDFSMCHDMNSQWPTRQCTAAYLSDVAQSELFSPAVSERLAAAAESYQDAYDAWVVAYKHVGWAAPEGAGRDAQHRQAAAAAIREAAQHEADALAELKRVLAAEGVDAEALSEAAQGVRLVQAEPVFDIPKLADHAAADLEELDDQAFAVDLLAQVNSRQGSDDFDAQFTLHWTDDALMVTAAVTDDDFVSAESLDALWANEADCVLLYVQATGGELLRIMVDPGMTADQPAPRILHRTETDRQGEVTARRRKGSGEYVLEISAPWEFIGVEPAEGQELRVQLAALDVDRDGSGREIHGLMWYPRVGTREDASLSYWVRLGRRASPPFQVLVTHTDFDFYYNQHHTFTITALSEAVGQTVRVVGGGQTLAEGDIAPGEPGYAGARIAVPMGRSFDGPGELTVTVNGETVATFDPTPAADN